MMSIYIYIYITQVIQSQRVCVFTLQNYRLKPATAMMTSVLGLMVSVSKPAHTPAHTPTHTFHLVLSALHVDSQ